MKFKLNDFGQKKIDWEKGFIRNSDLIWPFKSFRNFRQLHTGSYNRKALQVAKKMAAELGAEVSEIDLKTKFAALWLWYRGAGLAERQKFKAAVEASDVLLIASPEYNYSISEL